MHRPLSLLVVLTAIGCAPSGPPSVPSPTTTAPPPDASAAGIAPGATTSDTTMAAGIAPGATTAAGTTPDTRSVASFSDAQSDRGRSVFRALCTECHASSDFSDARFKRRWSRRTAGSLFDLIRSTMPESAPGSLRPDHVVDVVSYILRMNGFTPGTAELAPDPAVLDAISLARIGGS